MRSERQDGQRDRQRLLQLTRRIAGMAGMAVAVGACATPLTDDECDQLLDRYTEALLEKRQPDLPIETVALKKKLARKRAHEEPIFEFARCAKAVSRRQFDCAMTAHGVDSIERCLTL